MSRAPKPKTPKGGPEGRRVAPPEPAERSRTKAADISLDDWVRVGSTDLCGIVRYNGRTDFAAGVWLGLELRDATGKNDGSVDGLRYFGCRPNHGLFVRAGIVSKVTAEEAKAAAEAAAATQKAAALAVAPAALAAREPCATATPRRAKKAGPAEAAGAAARGAGRSLSRSWSPPQRGRAGAGPQKPMPKMAYSSESDRDDRQALFGSPRRRPPKPLSQSNGNEDKDSLARKVQLSLAEAAEDHDTTRIRDLLKLAKEVGVSPQEMASAHNILNFEAQQLLLAELDDLRLAVENLVRCVENAERRTADIERSAMEAARQQVHALIGRAEAQAIQPPPVAFSSSQLESVDIEAGPLAQRVWQHFEQRVDQAIESAVSKATEELSSLAAEARMLREDGAAAFQPPSVGSDAVRVARSWIPETPWSNVAFLPPPTVLQTEWGSKDNAYLSGALPADGSSPGPEMRTLAAPQEIRQDAVSAKATEKALLQKKKSGLFRGATFVAPDASDEGDNEAEAEQKRQKQPAAKALPSTSHAMRRSLYAGACGRLMAPAGDFGLPAVDAETVAKALSRLSRPGPDGDEGEEGRRRAEEAEFEKIMSRKVVRKRTVIMDAPLEDPQGAGPGGAPKAPVSKPRKSVVLTTFPTVELE